LQRDPSSGRGIGELRQICHIESLLRRAFKSGDPPRINPLVDFYNAVSLRHAVPAGGFDLEEIDETLELRLTRAGDAFHPLDGSAPEGVGPGEVAYASGAEILTRHFVYKQSRKALLDGSTTSLFLVSEVLGEVEAEGGVAEAVLEGFARGLRRHFGAEPATFIVEEGSPEIPLR
jgi:DNA/RNA-binding domain of Phe-tRNA-synthetase-like protein